MPERYPPDDPREWLNRARSALRLAQGEAPGDLCYQAQQAAEKAIKALLIAHSVSFPYVHDLARLLSLLEEAGQPIPDSVKEAEALTSFAVFTRYPGTAAPVTHERYEEAVELAEAVVNWATKHLPPT